MSVFRELVEGVAPELRGVLEKESSPLGEGEQKAISFEDWLRENRKNPDLVGRYKEYTKIVEELKSPIALNFDEWMKIHFVSKFGAGEEAEEELEVAFAFLEEEALPVKRTASDVLDELGDVPLSKREASVKTAKLLIDEGQVSIIAESFVGKEDVDVRHLIASYIYDSREQLGIPEATTDTVWKAVEATKAYEQGFAPESDLDRGQLTDIERDVRSVIEEAVHTLDEWFHGTMSSVKRAQKSEFQCQECGKKFKKKLGPRTYEVKCPGCGSTDVYPLSEFAESPKEDFASKRTALLGTSYSTASANREDLLQFIDWLKEEDVEIDFDGPREVLNIQDPSVLDREGQQQLLHKIDALGLTTIASKTAAIVGKCDHESTSSKPDAPVWGNNIRKTEQGVYELTIGNKHFARDTKEKLESAVREAHPKARFEWRSTASIKQAQGTSWTGKQVRDKNGREGEIVKDINWNRTRSLTIRFDDGEEYTLNLNNIGPDLPDPLEIEWEYRSGQWGYISSHPEIHKGKPTKQAQEVITEAPVTPGLHDVSLIVSASSEESEKDEQTGLWKGAGSITFEFSGHQVGSDFKWDDARYEDMTGTVYISDGDRLNELARFGSLNLLEEWWGVNDALGLEKKLSKMDINWSEPFLSVDTGVFRADEDGSITKVGSVKVAYFPIRVDDIEIGQKVRAVWEGKGIEGTVVRKDADKGVIKILDRNAALQEVPWNARFFKVTEAGKRTAARDIPMQERVEQLFAAGYTQSEIIRRVALEYEPVTTEPRRIWLPEFEEKVELMIESAKKKQSKQAASWRDLKKGDVLVLSRRLKALAQQGPFTRSFPKGAEITVEKADGGYVFFDHDRKGYSFDEKQAKFLDKKEEEVEAAKKTAQLEDTYSTEQANREGLKAFLSWLDENEVDFHFDGATEKLEITDLSVLSEEGQGEFARKVNELNLTVVASKRTADEDGLTNAEADILVDAYHQGETSIVFGNKEGVEAAESLVSKGLLKKTPSETSPFHNRYKLTYNGKRAVIGWLRSHGYEASKKVAKYGFSPGMKLKRDDGKVFEIKAVDDEKGTLLLADEEGNESEAQQDAIMLGAPSGIWRAASKKIADVRWYWCDNCDMTTKHVFMLAPKKGYECQRCGSMYKDAAKRTYSQLKYSTLWEIEIQGRGSFQFQAPDDYEKAEGIARQQYTIDPGGLKFPPEQITFTLKKIEPQKKPSSVRSYAELKRGARYYPCTICKRDRKETDEVKAFGAAKACDSAIQLECGHWFTKGCDPAVVKEGTCFERPGDIPLSVELASARAGSREGFSFKNFFFGKRAADALHSPLPKEIVHEEKRIRTMKPDALERRLDKITKPQKMYSFALALLKAKMKDLADMAFDHLKDMGYDASGKWVGQEMAAAKKRGVLRRAVGEEAYWKSVALVQYAYRTMATEKGPEWFVDFTLGHFSDDEYVKEAEVIMRDQGEASWLPGDTKLQELIDNYVQMREGSLRGARSTRAYKRYAKAFEVNKR